METQLLHVFRTVAHLGSITSAARPLRFTQSAVSRQVAALEAELGARLFDRVPRGVTLTEAGRRLLPYAEGILDRLTEARQAVDALRTVGRARLRVGAFPTAVAELVPRALATFRAAYPEAGLTLVEGLTPTLLDRVAAGTADIAVVSASPAAPLDASRFALRHLLDEHLLVAVSVHHRLAGRETVGLAELADDPFIVGSATDESALLHANLPDGFTPKIDIVVADWTGKLGCVAAQLGVALVPALALRAAPADVVLLRLDPADEPTRQVFAATPAGRPPSPAVLAFLTHLRDAATRHDPTKTGA
ncbi:LysR family transcriptional regulator [Paractinoplanes ferrugineus]|uniref:LysR family transcriptional regulator n=1 Tax=Paractinoplanes ferrugineus TaxID=113564 RepID=A0A919MHQ6_9ACTN|nr:LysR family transcriptional regulator [Actinoplanes ferrugineus]GIE12885.1 LysR family transcriptional regulator [Actinoplanes ferrugineus]